jgi:hypothetical protein
MRKGFTIYLALFFFLGPLAAALPASQDAFLPSCCRRSGAHHCAMNMATIMRMAAGMANSPAFSAPTTCPYYPGAAVMLLPVPHAMLTTPAALPALRARGVSIFLSSSPVPFTAIASPFGRAPPAAHPSTTA